MRRTFATLLLMAVSLLAACSGGGGEGKQATGEATARGEVADWKIAYVSYVEGDPEIYVMNPDGSGRTALTRNEEDDSFPSWSPAGSHIAFTRGVGSPGALEIFVVSADGGGEKRLTKHGDNSDPAWSPDDMKIAFRSSRDNPTGDVYVMNADGSEQTRLTETPNLTGSGGPVWSPDGTKIAFTSDRGQPETPALYVMNADGTGETRLTRHRDLEGSPSWSPDGSKIVFSRFTGRYEIHVINTDGTNDRVLPEGSKMSNTGPIWSPDGSEIAFTGERLNGVGGALYVMNSDGSDLRRLVRYPFVSSGHVWTPDGSRLIFSRCYLEADSRGNAYCDIVSVKPRGGGVTTLIPGQGEAYGPVVSPR